MADSPLEQFGVLPTYYIEKPHKGSIIENRSEFVYPRQKVVKPKGPPSPGWPHALTGTALSRTTQDFAYKGSTYSFKDSYNPRKPSGTVQPSVRTIDMQNTHESVLNASVVRGFLGFPLISSTVEGDTVDTIKNRSVSRAVEEANSATYNVFEDLAEVSESANLFLNTMKLLTSPVKTTKKLVDDFMKQCRKRGVSGAPNPFTRHGRKAMGVYLPELTSLWLDAWMSWRYGIMPILYSAQDASKLIKNVSDKKYSYTYSSTQSGSERSELIATSDVPGVRGELKRERVNSISVTTRIIDRIIISDSEPGGGANALLYGLMRSPAKTAWDIAKWAWVIDWFCNAGAKVASLGGTPSCVAERVTYIVTRQTTFDSGWQGSWSRSKHVEETQYTSDLDGTFTARGDMYSLKSYDRKVIFGTPKVALQFDPYVSSKRLVDAAALLKSIVRR